MKRIIAKFWCGIAGHLRGRRVNRPEYEAQGVITYFCPRCSATWQRKGKVKG